MVPSVKYTYADCSIKLPMVLLYRFKKMNRHNGTCKLCNILISWDSKCIVSHLFDCDYKLVSRNLFVPSIKKFICNVCKYSTNLFNTHKLHIASHDHLVKCHDMSNYFSYYCNVCNLYMYGSEIVIKKH